MLFQYLKDRRDRDKGSRHPMSRSLPCEGLEIRRQGPLPLEQEQEFGLSFSQGTRQVRRSITKSSCN